MARALTAVCQIWVDIRGAEQHTIPLPGQVLGEAVGPWFERRQEADDIRREDRLPRIVRGERPPPDAEHRRY